MELFEQIRRARRREPGVPIRELARRFGTHRRTVREAFESAVPAPRRPVTRSSPVMEPWKVTIDGWLEADREAPRKQRHTARRVWQRLVDEHQAIVGESTVRRYVAEVRRRHPTVLAEVMVPQRHVLGAEGEVDFGRVHAVVGGVETDAWMFVMRLSASGRGFHRVYRNEAQQAFLDGHVRGFEHFGGVPGRIRYDNLKPAVVRVLKGRDRDESERFIALKSHYGFDAFFCRPGIDGAHEKGGVEGEVGRFRRRHFVPVPKVGSLVELNELVAAGDVADDRRRIGGRTMTVGEHFAAEALTLQDLPVERFDVTLLLTARVDAKSRVCVRQNFYSVPARFAGRRVDVRLGAEFVEALDAKVIVACHERLAGRGGESLVLDHYLEVLKVKPGALPGATALARARAQGAFSVDHDDYWTTARKRLGDRAGTRAMVEVMLAHRSLPADAIRAGIRACLTIGVIDPDVVIVEARRAVAERDPVVVPIGALARYDRPTPTIAHFDELLKEAR
ncbi:MAG: IS21 family transposase [Pseudonocardia sp.]|nr:IS21 family transposase [Pseudonocardia sp.]